MISSPHSDTALFKYQEDISGYVNGLIQLYNFIGSKVKQYAGGFNNKDLLEIGAGYQLPQGGINLVLSLYEGARRCFGIDIAHPCNVCTKNGRRTFWSKVQEALDDLSITGYRNDDRLRFISEDILWFDDRFNRITLLQMSASNMYFRDNMFDLVISNAVFEHVKEPGKVLKEMERVLKPGGYAVMRWNPFTSLDMGGHDIGIPYYYPWAHLRLKEEEHIIKLREVFSDESVYTAVFPSAHVPTAGIAMTYAKDPKSLRDGMLADLNKVRINEFFAMAKNNGFQIIDADYQIPDENRIYLTEDIRKELAAYSENELLVSSLTVVLKKIKLKHDRNLELLRNVIHKRDEEIVMLKAELNKCQIEQA